MIGPERTTRDSTLHRRVAGAEELNRVTSPFRGLAGECGLLTLLRKKEQSHKSLQSGGHVAREQGSDKCRHHRLNRRLRDFAGDHDPV